LPSTTTMSSLSAMTVPFQLACMLEGMPLPP